MVYLSLSIFGGILFLITSVLDYYWSRLQTRESPAIETATSPSDIPVGSKPTESDSSPLSNIEPRYVGYILAVLLQLPALVSQLGWI